MLHIDLNILVIFFEFNQFENYTNYKIWYIIDIYESLMYKKCIFNTFLYNFTSLLLKKNIKKRRV